MTSAGRRRQLDTAVLSLDRAMMVLTLNKPLSPSEMREVRAHVLDAMEALHGDDGADLADLSTEDLRSLFDPSTLTKKEC